MPVLELAFVRVKRVVRGFPTGTKHHKSQNEKAKPVLERASARIRTGTHSKMGNASFRTGNFLIRVLTYILNYPGLPGETNFFWLPSPSRINLEELISSGYPARLGLTWRNQSLLVTQPV